MTVLIVTVTYNSSSAIRPFLGSLSSAVSVPSATVVVDNASADSNATQAVVEEMGARFLGLDRNDGYGAGITAGVDAFEGRAEFILVVNPDVVFTPGSIDRLVEVARAHPLAASVGPRILEPDGSVYPSARNLPSLRTGIGHALLARSWPDNPWTRRYRASDLLSDEIREAGWLSGACLLVRKRAFDEIGGFDSSFFMYFEDVDLGARFARSGWKNIYAPMAAVTHTGAHSTAQVAGAMERIHHESAYRFLSRKYSGWHLTPLRAAIRVGLAIRFWWRNR